MKALGPNIYMYIRKCAQNPLYNGETTKDTYISNNLIKSYCAANCNKFYVGQPCSSSVSVIEYPIPCMQLRIIFCCYLSAGLVFLIS